MVTIGFQKITHAQNTITPGMWNNNIAYNYAEIPIPTASPTKRKIFETPGISLKVRPGHITLLQNCIHFDVFRTLITYSKPATLPSQTLEAPTHEISAMANSTDRYFQ